ncbi:MAG: hypothetical protein WC308_03035 [archaeon]|jgi:hypothetical protein
MLKRTPIKRFGRKAGVARNPPPDLVRAVEKRFDGAYRRDFVAAYRRSPEEAKKLLNSWLEF